MGIPAAIIGSALIGAGSAAHGASKQREAARDAKKEMARQEELEVARRKSARQSAADTAAQMGSSRSSNILARRTTLG